MQGSSRFLKISENIPVKYDFVVQFQILECSLVKIAQFFIYLCKYPKFNFKFKSTIKRVLESVDLFLNPDFFPHSVI